MRLIPRDEGFFDLFEQLAQRLRTAAELLAKLFAEPARIEHYMGAIKEVEHEADNITHAVSARIDRSFVTPFDREDIHHLAQELDNVVDLIDGTARRATMFHLKGTREPARLMSEIIMRATEHIETAVLAVKQPKAVSERSRAIKLLEEEGDALYHDSVAALFAGSPDPLEVMKWKEIYDTLERTLDQCQTVANVLESISLKNS